MALLVQSQGGYYRPLCKVGWQLSAIFSQSTQVEKWFLSGQFPKL